MKNQKGFTLIEIVMVILLLGILAAVALPRFFDLGASADRAVGRGGIGGIASARTMYYASMLAAGSPGYPGNPIDGSVMTDLYSRGATASTPTGTCASLGLQGQWSTDSLTNAGAIFYRWKSGNFYSSWSYSSATGIITPRPEVEPTQNSCTP